MKSIRSGTAVVAFAVMGLTIVAFAYTAARGSIAGQPAAQGQQASPYRSPQAEAVEAEIARTNFTHRLETAMGDGFGGVWFEPATAQVHIGVTSPASRRHAEAVAAQTGLTDAIREIPVRSAWAELRGVQRRWDRRLADLFEQGQVTTWPSPQGNSVEVELGSSVPSSRREALRRAAASAPVEVSISVSGHSRFGFTPQARCKAQAKGAAHCNSPIVAGVTIRSPKEAEEPEEEEEGEEEGEPEIEIGVEHIEGEGKKPFNCTAGPVVRLNEPTNKEERTKTYLLTAGHCIDPAKGGGGVGKKWEAFNMKSEEHVIGPAAAYIPNGTDVGLIEVTTEYWAFDNDFIPVHPTIAKWGKTESEPFPVVARVTPMVDTQACHAGQTTGVSCGEIVKTGATLSGKGKLKLNEVVEVLGGTYDEGDSGGPWFTKDQYEKEIPTGYALGVHIGINPKTKRGIFHSLDTDFAALKSSKGFDLELLTEENERRHSLFFGEKYPATVEAKDTTSNDVFTAFGTSVKCTENEFDGVMSEPDPKDETAEVEVAPVYGGCTSGGSLPTKFTSNGCKYKFTVTSKVAAGHYKAELGIVCPGESPGLQFHVYANESNQTGGITMCKLTVPPQSGLKTVTLTNSGGKIVADATTLEGFKVKIHRNLFLCPSSGTENETSSGAIQINEPVTFAGSSEEEEVGIAIEGG